MEFQLSVVIPAYNEAARLGRTLSVVVDYLNDLASETELIVVDDGSSDRTSQVAEDGFSGARRFHTRLIRNEPNRGKGHAVRTGLLAAHGRIALFTDADLSTPISELPRLIEPVITGVADLTFGSRALDRSLIGVRQPWLRDQSGRIFNLVVRRITRMPFWDTQCGFKAFRMNVCRPIIEGCAIDRFGFDVELLYLARVAGLRLQEIPVRWDDTAGSTVSFFGGLHGFTEVAEIRRNARRGIYDRALQAARRAKNDEAPQDDSEEVSDGPRDEGGATKYAASMKKVPGI